MYLRVLQVVQYDPEHIKPTRSIPYGMANATYAECLEGTSDKERFKEKVAIKIDSLCYTKEQARQAYSTSLVSIVGGMQK